MSQLYPSSAPTSSLRSPSQPAVPAASPGQPEEPQEHPPQAQALLTTAQTLDLNAKNLRALWVMNSLMLRGLEVEGDRVKGLLDKLQTKEQELDRRETAIKSKDEGADEKLRSAEEKLEEARKREESAEKIEKKNQEDEERIKPLLEKELEIKEECELQKKAAAEARADRELAERERTTAEAAKRETENFKRAIEEYQRQFWPQCLRGDEWTEWQRSLLETARHESCAALLVAAFHRFCASEKSSKADELAEALVELGRCLYRYTQDQNCIQAIGNALNSSANGRFSLRLPSPGAPPDDRWMTYNPGLPSVNEVVNWAVCVTGPDKDSKYKAVVR